MVPYMAITVGMAETSPPQNSEPSLAVWGHVGKAVSRDPSQLIAVGTEQIANSAQDRLAMAGTESTHP